VPRRGGDPYRKTNSKRMRRERINVGRNCYQERENNQGNVRSRRYVETRRKRRRSMEKRKILSKKEEKTLKDAGKRGERVKDI